MPGRMPVKVKMLDLDRLDSYQDKEIKDAIMRVVDSKAFIMGEEVVAFEKEFARFIGTNFALGVANGTDAITLALLAMEIGPGDEVITTDFSFYAGAESIAQVGATPVFADIDINTFNMDLNEVEKLITPKTKAVIATHLFGQPLDVVELKKMCDAHKLLLIEDCAQAHGALNRGRRVGSIGDIGCFSFFPSKPLGCYGDGGMITSSNQYYRSRIMSLRHHGQSTQKYIHETIGFNSRLDGIQAAILGVKIKKLDTYNQLRIANANYLTAKLSEVDGIITPFVQHGVTPVYHQYTIRSERRNHLHKRLISRGIESRIYYPCTIGRQPCWEDRTHCPNSILASQTALSLPIDPFLEYSDIDYIAHHVKELMTK